jgi:hypothetical protein
MAQRKETKKTIQVRDLKPKKDAKGGRNPVTRPQTGPQTRPQTGPQTGPQTIVG